LGPGGSNGGRGHRKILSVMFKYAVFDIKPTYDRYFFVISDAQVHCVCQCSIKNYYTVLYSTKILLGGQSCGSRAFITVPAVTGGYPLHRLSVGIHQLSVTVRQSYAVH